VTSGSGVVIGREGLVLTAAHVAGREGRGCFVILEDGTRLLGISVAVNSRHDFAIVKVPGVAELCAAELADGNRVGEGSEVIAIGYSRGFRAGRPASVRRCRRTSRGSDMPQSAASIYSDAALVPGDSGGPLFDRGGRLVGIHVQALRTSDGAAAMHVSIEVIRPVLAELRRRANPLSVLSQSP
jgi:S1-C subfamily serine protease